MKNENIGIKRLCTRCEHKKDIRSFHETDSVCKSCKRARLLKEKPLFREINILDGDRYHQDIALLWVAHKKKPFYSIDKNISQEDFAKSFLEFSKYSEILIAEDKTKEFPQVGPAAIFVIHTDGWKIEPHAEFFPWCSKRNILKITVGFLQMIRYKQIGCCMVFSVEPSKNLFDKVCSYGVLHVVGTVHNGDPRGDTYLYSVKGQRESKE